MALTPRQVDSILRLVWPITGLLAIAALLLNFRETLTMFSWASDFLADVAGLGTKTAFILTGVGAVVCIGLVGLRWHIFQTTMEHVSSSTRLSFSNMEVTENAPISYLKRTSEIIRVLSAENHFDSVSLFTEITASGFSVGASDIHIAPERNHTRIVFRVDGVLHEVGTITSSQARFLVNRIKVLAAMSIHITSTPQDGRIAFDCDDYQLRVSTLPTNNGEKVVIRLAENDERRYNIDKIGFDPDNLLVYKTLLGRDRGVIYLTGPTGSGKTTTMYASMMYIRAARGGMANLVTLEDPVEVDFTNISQTQISPETGLTFAVGLRSVLRQDPDVIMVGEIRDEETARTAIRAGMTGHLMLTSVHAESSIGVFSRLDQLQVDRFQAASASIGVVNQRLAIRNCEGCTNRVELSDFERQQLKVLGVSNEGPFFSGTGCNACRGKGRVGRTPLIEVLVVNDEIRDLLISGTPEHIIMETAVSSGMETIAMKALQEATRGVIPIDEVIRVLSL
jgi:general secretion pathway protein E